MNHERLLFQLQNTAGQSALSSSRIEDVERILAVRQWNADALALVQQGNHAGAIVELEKLIESFPDYSMAYNDLGNLYYAKESKERAFQHFKKAVEIDSSNTLALKNLADFYHVELKQIDEAADLYEKILTLNSQNIDALIMLGNLSITRNHFEKALKCFLDVLELDLSNELAGKMFDALVAQKKDGLVESNPELTIREAGVLVQRGMSDRAICILELLLESYPNHASAHNFLGNLYWVGKDIEKGLLHLHRAIQIAPEKARFLNDLADLQLVELGNIEDALKLYNDALANNPNDTDILLKIGNICAAEKRFEDAKFFYRRVLSVDRKNTQAKENLSVLKTMIQSRDLEVVSCPFCLKTEAEPVRSSADIVRCLECGIVYLRTRLKKEAMRAVYQTYADGFSHMALPADSTAIKSSGLRRDYFLNELLGFAKPEGTLLDIGCGWGAFLDNARGKGFSVRGIEITQKCVTFANETLKIQVTDESFAETRLEDKSIAVVTLLHVFEHLPEPKNAIEKAYRILKPGGILCGIVPNIESFCSQELGERWHWLDPQYHYVHYAPSTLRRCLESAGFTIERMYTATGDYGLDNVLKVVPREESLTTAESADSIIERIERDGFGEEIRFFARKPLTGRLPAGTSRDEHSLNHQRITCSELMRSETRKGGASIIIPVFNQLEFTVKCLKTLYGNTPLDRIEEVIVVDNASSDGTNAFLQEARGRYPKLKILTNKENLLFAKACNQAGYIAGGDYLVFLNNDTEPLAGWLERALERLEGDGSIGIVGIKLLYPDGSVQHCGIQFQRNSHPSYAIWPLYRYRCTPADDPRVNVPEDVHAVTGACLFIRRELFKRIGGFEEKYGMYFEDTDLCFKASRAGKRVFYEPGSVVIHHHRKSSPSRDIIDNLNAKAAVLFFKTWREELYRVELENLIEKEDGKYVYLSSNFWPEEVTQDAISRMHHLLKNFPDCYVHFGGSGDALLLLSTFYDRDMAQSIVSVSNSTDMMRSFFDAFPKLKKIYFIPFPKNYNWHFIGRRLFKSSKNCLGLGATPTTEADYREWNSNLDIFETYGIRRRPIWAVNFEKNRLDPLQVVIQPRGSLKGMVGSKRNVINPKDWSRLLSYIAKKGFRPVIIGTPDEEKEYPCIEQAIDSRSYSFLEQMKLIAGSDFFVGADSWGKTFAALAGIPTFVFHALRGDDLKGWKDDSDFVFLDPWEEITVVKNFSEFRKSFDAVWRHRSLMETDLKIRWEGTQFVNHSLALVNRELCLRLIEMGCEVSIIPYERDQFTPRDEPRFIAIAERTNKPLSGHAHVHVRHQWPPNFTPPPEGHWVIIQPWEFGSIPQEWVRQMSTHIDEIWVPSYYVRDCYIRSGVPSERVFVVPNGVNTCRFNPENTPYPLKTEKAFKFLFIGGTIQRKGIDILLDVYAKTFSSRDDVCLVIKDMGGHTFYKRQTSEEWIRRFQADPSNPEIEYIENTLSELQIAGLYTASNCLVHPYRGEGFGLPIAEAMASELPVIVTGYGAALDFCRPENSYLLPAKEIRLSEKKVGGLYTVDYPWLAEPDRESLKALMRHVIECPNDAMAKARAARIKIETDFTWEKATEKAIRRLNEIIHKPVVRLNHKQFAKIKGRKKESTVSIVIRVYSDLESVKKCFLKIKKHSSVNHEVIFITHNTKKNELKWVKQVVRANKNCRNIENEKDVGWARENNQGIRKSSGDYILLLDPHVEVTDNWLADLIECVKHKPRIGIVGAVSDRTGDRSESDHASPAFGHRAKEYALLFRERNRHRRIPAKKISNICMLFKRQLADEIGFIDENFDDSNFGAEDLCLRASLSGYQNMIAGDVFIHYHNNINSAGRSAEHDHLKTNRRTFNEKWYGVDAQQRFGQRLMIENATAKAEELYQQGQIEKAGASLIEAIKKVPRDRSLYFRLAEMLIDSKKYDDALGILETVPLEGADARQLSLLGYCEEALGRDKKAQEYSEAALAIDPSMALALNIMGVVAYKKRERENAEGLFKKAIDADPSFGESYTNLGSLKWAAGEHTEALNHFERGFILSPTVGDVMMAYHSAVAETNSFARAERVFREAAALHPNDKRIAFFLIAILIQQENHFSAIQAIEHGMMKFGMDDGILSAALNIRSKIGPLEIDPESLNKNKLSLCVIVKNEEQHLAKCLMSVKSVVDEMIVIDTGSTDHSRDIARTFGAKVFDYDWNGDFSKARNFSIDQASGDWILVLDADEVISAKDLNDLKALFANASKTPAAYSIQTRNYTFHSNVLGLKANKGEYPEEDGIGWVPSTKVRLFTNDARIRFVNPVHELVEPSLKAMNIPILNSRIPVHHFGKLNETKTQRKTESYFDLGKKKLKKNRRNPSAMKEYAIQCAHLGKHEEALRQWKQFAKLKSESAEAYLNMGTACWNLARYAEAAEFTDKALLLDPALKEAKFNRALGLLVMGRAGEAKAILQSILEERPEYSAAQFMLCVACACVGEAQQVEDEIAKIQTTALWPYLGESFLDIAKRLFSASQIEYARRALEVAVNLNYANDEIMSLLADCRAAA